MSDDRSYLYGDALFETVRVDDKGGAVALAHHVARFVRSANALAYPDHCMHAGVAALGALQHAEPGIYRVTVSRDDPRAPFEGAGSVTTRVRALPDEPPPRPRLIRLRGWYFPDDELAEHKTTSYVRSVEARRRALAFGADDALLVSSEGLIGEASTSNVFVEFRSGLATPPVRGILPGVTRGRILKTIGATVRPIHVDELENAIEIILTNAANIAVAALDLDGRSLTGYRALDFIESLSAG